MLQNVKICFVHPKTKEPLKYWSSESPHMPDFFAVDDAPGDYAAIAVMPLFKEVVGRLLKIAEAGGKDG